jgi:polyphosphate kinase
VRTNLGAATRRAGGTVAIESAMPAEALQAIERARPDLAIIASEPAWHGGSGLLRLRNEASCPVALLARARAGRAGRIIAKMNGLADRALIEELYEASGAAVQIDLIVRGLCCLRPEVPGLSDNIRVISIVDRHLEHARIFYFENGGGVEYLLASADWMPRNLDRRVETAFPVVEPGLEAQVREILEIQLADTVMARRILSDGRSERLRAGGALPLRAQERLYEATAPGGIFA